MRPVLGVAVDDGEITAALVDADVVLLGPFDSQRWPVDPEVPVGDAVAAAVTAMIERAAAADLTVDRIGVVAPPGVADDVVAAVSEVSEFPVEVVPLDRARLAFLGGAHELAEHDVIALHTRTDGAESVSITDIRSGAVRSSVVRGDDALTGHVDSLPDVADEAVARAGVAPQALVFLDLRPGDRGPARELAGILRVPFVTPHGVPWHRATGAALVAAARGRPAAAAATVAAGRRPGWVFACALVALAVLLGGGLAVAVGGSTGSGHAPSVGVTETLAPVPTQAPAGQDRTAEPDPCAQARPASWPLHRSDPVPGSDPDPGGAPAEPGDPCGTSVPRQP